MILSRIDEIIELAKFYINQYNLEIIEAIECAIAELEKEVK